MPDHDPVAPWRRFRREDNVFNRGRDQCAIARIAVHIQYGPAGLAMVEIQPFAIRADHHQVKIIAIIPSKDDLHPTAARPFAPRAFRIFLARRRGRRRLLNLARWWWW